MSYLLFTPKYTRELINLGYHDAGKRIDEIEDYLFSSDNNGSGKSVGSASKNGRAREPEPASRRTTPTASRG